MCVNKNMAESDVKDRFDAAVKVIQSLPKNGQSLFFAIEDTVVYL